MFVEVATDVFARAGVCDGGAGVFSGASVRVGCNGVEVAVADSTACLVGISVGRGVALGLGEGEAEGLRVAEGKAPTAGGRVPSGGRGVPVGSCGAIVGGAVPAGGGGVGTAVLTGWGWASCRLGQIWPNAGVTLGPLPPLHAQPSTSPSRTL